MGEGCPAKLKRSAERSRVNKMYYVYFLRSQTRPEKTYVGFSQDVPSRLDAHNSGEVDSTLRFRPWTLVAYVAVASRERAMELERYFKSGSGHAFWHKRFE